MSDLGKGDRLNIEIERLRKREEVLIRVAEQLRAEVAVVEAGLRHRQEMSEAQGQEIDRLRKLMAECPECRLQSKVDRLGPNPDNKTIDELRAEERGGDD